MNPPIRKTSEGYVVTNNKVGLWIGILTILGLLTGGVTGIVHALAPTRDEFTKQETRITTHMHDDSVTHREIREHDAFQDSIIVQQGRANHELGCYNAGYPPALCGDVQLPPPRRHP